MSVAIRLPSRIGTITLRSTMESDCSSFSVATRAAAACGVSCARAIPVRTRTVRTAMDLIADQCSCRSLDGEREFAFVGLVPDSVLYLDSDFVLARLDVLLKIDAHRSRDVALRVERVGALDGRLRLRPKHLPARRDNRGDVRDVDLVLRPELVADDIEVREDAVTGFENGL